MKSAPGFTWRLALVVGALGSVAWAQTTTRPARAVTETRPLAAAESRRPESAPIDPKLKAALDAMNSRIKALRNPTDVEVEAIDAELATLTQRLRTMDPRASAWIDEVWGWDCLQRLAKPATALKAYQRVARAFEAAGDAAGLARIAQNRALALAGLRQFQAALDAYRTAEAHFRKVGDQVNLARIAEGRAQALAAIPRVPEALEAYAEAASYLEKAGDRAGIARISESRGIALASVSRFPEALREFDVAQGYYEKAGDERAAANVALNRTTALISVSRFDEALAACAAAEPYLTRVGDEDRLAAIQFARGTVHLNLSQLTEALPEFAAAEATYRKLGLGLRIAETAVRRASVLERLSRFDDAHSAYDEAETYYRSVRDETGLATVSMARAGAFQSASRHGEALAAYSRAEEYFRSIGDEGSVAWIAMSRSGIDWSHSRFVDALRALSQAEGFYRKTNDQARLAALATNRAVILMGMSRYAEALQDFARAEAFFRREDNKGALASLALNRGVALDCLARPEEALAAYADAEPYFVEIGADDHLAMIATNRGAALRGLNRHQAALAAFAEARKRFESLGDAEGLASISMSEAVVLCDLSRNTESLAALAAAEPWFRMAGDLHRLAMIAANRGNALRADRRLAEALTAYSESAKFVEAMLRTQVQALGEPSSESYRVHFLEVAANSIGCLTATDARAAGSVATAYGITQTFLALGVLESLAENRDLRVPEGSDLAGRERKVRQELEFAIAKRDTLRIPHSSSSAQADKDLAAASSRIEELAATEGALLEEVRLAMPLTLAIDFPRGRSLLEVEQAVPASAALLEYVFDENGSCVFVIRRSGTQVLDLGGPAEIAKDLQAVTGEMRQGGSRKGHPAQSEALRRLGRRLLDPVLKAFGKDDRPKTLLFALHGELCRLPFELLLTDDPAPKSATSSWPFLVKSFDVAYVHSGTVMHAMREEAKKPRASKTGQVDLVAFGFPYDAEAESKTSGREDLPVEEIPLRGGGSARSILFQSADEVIDIARQFATGKDEEGALDGAKAAFEKDALSTTVGRVQGKRFSVFLRQQANEKALRTEPAVGSARIVHFACHGESDLTTPRMSRLVLSRSKKLQEATGEDGYVYVQDLKRLKLSADLLVLSACGTNDGTRSPVEGITGLSRAGLVAGARSVISTLWPVRDEGARALMVDFYRRWIGGGTTRVHALCDAKREAIVKGRPLETWSAYTLFDAEVE